MSSNTEAGAANYTFGNNKTHSIAPGSQRNPQIVLPPSFFLK